VETLVEGATINEIVQVLDTAFGTTFGTTMGTTLGADRACDVTMIETHLSRVFLVGAYAFKAKKPTRHNGHDFRTLQARHFYCDEELRLNRVLAPSVYLNVVPLVRADKGQVSLLGKGQPVEWLVQMRRLSADSMMDALMARHALSDASVQALAGRLAHFHANQPRAPIPASQYLHGLQDLIDASEQTLVDPAWMLPHGKIQALANQLRQWLGKEAGQLNERFARGCVVLGHGDLRPQHVCFEEPVPLVIDCLEFSEALRTLDVADEIGFLALECEAARHPDIAHRVIEHYRQASGDPLPAPVLAFFQGLRACIRARLTIAHLVDPHCADPRHWRRLTLRYLALARRHVKQLAPKPVPAFTGD